MIGPWERIEGSSHDDELDSGVEARIADPLWMLARQWQVGELRGDDAGSPAVARLDWTSIPLRSYRAGGGPDEPMPTTSPLERMVEATAPPTYGAGALYWATRLAGQISRRLVRQGLDDAVGLLRVGFPLADDGTTVALRGAGTTAAALARGRGFDGAAVFSDSTRTTAALAPLPAERRDQVDAVITRWRADVSARFGIPAADAWNEHRLEYQFNVTAATAPDGPDPDVVLTADKYTGGHLDWYSFDIDPGRQQADQPTAAPAGTHSSTATTAPAGVGDDADRSVAALPTPVRYSGMPAPRWWAFEDGDVHFGDIAADPGDLGRLLLADYATGYGDDWFSVPLRLPIATLTRVTGLHVFDTMGRRVEVPCAALLDDRKPGRRAFRLYELTGDTSVADGQAPLLFVPPSLSGSEVGPALDRVEFVRDEAANLVWAVERLVEGPTGRAVDRLQQWRTSTPPGSPPAPAPPARRPGGTAAGDAWRYRVEAAAPPYWIPFLPVRTGNGAQIRLRRARMRDWQLLDPAVVGARSELLRTAGPMNIEEQEVPRGGITVQRRWQAARWTDGSMQVWLQRSKQPGSGERSSGVRWDSLDDHAAS